MTTTGHRFPKGIAPDDWQAWASTVDEEGRALYLGALGRLSCMCFPQVFQECCLQSNKVVFERCEPPDELEEGALGAILVDLPMLLDHPEIADALPYGFAVDLPLLLDHPENPDVQPFGFACIVVVPEGADAELVSKARATLLGKAAWVGLIGDPLGFVIDERHEFGSPGTLANILNLCFEDPHLFDVLGDIAFGGIVDGWTEHRKADHLFSGRYEKHLALRYSELTKHTPPLTHVWMRVGLAREKLHWEFEARRQITTPCGQPPPVPLSLEFVDIGGARYDWDTEVSVVRVWGGRGSPF